MVGHHLEGVAAIEVVGVDDGKRLVDDLLGHQDRVVGTPGLLASFGHRKAFGQVVEFLVDVFHLYLAVPAFAIEDLAEILVEAVTYDKDDFAESSTDGVGDGVVEDGLTVRTDSVHLLKSTVAAAHAGSKN